MQSGKRANLTLLKDKPAFRRSLEALSKWDFDRIIVGDGEVIETDGRRLSDTALKEGGF